MKHTFFLRLVIATTVSCTAVFAMEETNETNSNQEIPFYDSFVMGLKAQRWLKTFNQVQNAQENGFCKTRTLVQNEIANRTGPKPETIDNLTLLQKTEVYQESLAQIKHCARQLHNALLKNRAIAGGMLAKKIAPSIRIPFIEEGEGEDAFLVEMCELNRALDEKNPQIQKEFVELSDLFYYLTQVQRDAVKEICPWMLDSFDTKKVYGKMYQMTEPDSSTSSDSSVYSSANSSTDSLPEQPQPRYQPQSPDDSECYKEEHYVQLDEE